MVEEPPHLKAARKERGTGIDQGQNTDSEKSLVYNLFSLMRPHLPKFPPTPNNANYVSTNDL